MPLQKKNPDQIDLLATYFPRTNDMAYAWARLPGAYLMLPSTSATWLMTAYNSGSVADVSGSGRPLTATGSPLVGADGVRVYMPLNGSTQYLSSPATPFNLLNTGFTIIGWVYPQRATGTLEYLVSRGTPGTNGYHLRRTTGDFLELVTETKVFTSTHSIPSVSRWYHVAATYEASTAVALWLNGERQSNGTSVPASLDMPFGSFYLGRSDTTDTGYYAGFIGNMSVHHRSIGDAFIWLHFQQTRALYQV